MQRKKMTAQIFILKNDFLKAIILLVLRRKYFGLKKIICLFSFFWVVFFSCKKDSQPVANPLLSDIPAIQLISTTPTTVHQFVDSIKFVIQFTDGNGDVGDYNADSLSLVVVDNRNSSLVNRFHIPPVAPQGSTIAVQGQFSVVLKSIILLNAASTSETTTFSIKLKDRAGNWSNTVVSPTVTILP